MRAFYLAISVALLLAVTAGSASAASTVRVGTGSVSLASDTSFIGPETRSVRATVTLVAGEKGMRVGLDFGSPSFTRYVAGRPQREGSTLRLIGIESITGDWQTMGSGGGSSNDDVCDEGFVPSRGATNEHESYDLQLPAGKSVSATLRYEVLGDAPWANANYAPTVTVRPLYAWRGKKAQTNRQKWDYTFKSTTLSTLRPAIGLPLAGRVDLEFSPRLKFEPWGFGYVVAGKPLKITGKLVPARSGYPIEFWIDERRVKGTFLTDAAGRASHSIRPRAGYVSIRAAFPGMPGGDLSGDAGCSLTLDVLKATKGGGT